VPNTDGPVDLERLIAMIPDSVLRALSTAAQAAWSIAETISARLDPEGKRDTRKR
jgi:HTH-type transcriptional regulator, osmoprotectant uptake regulator